MTTLSRCVVLGAGGHARVLIECLQLAGSADVFGVLDPDPRLAGTTCSGVRILGGDELLATLANEGVDCFAIGVGGTGDTTPRRRLFEFALGHGLRPLTIVHPRAIRSSNATLGEGCQLMPGSIVNPGARIGRNAIVNSGAIVEHDCIVGDHAHIATGARLAGSVEIGEGAHIGAGATVLQQIRIGAAAIVGAGAVVVRPVPQRVTVVGVPARAVGIRE